MCSVLSQRIYTPCAGSVGGSGVLETHEHWSGFSSSADLVAGVTLTTWYAWTVPSRPLSCQNWANLSVRSALPLRSLKGFKVNSDAPKGSTGGVRSADLFLKFSTNGILKQDSASASYLNHFTGIIFLQLQIVQKLSYRQNFFLFLATEITKKLPNNLHDRFFFNFLHFFFEEFRKCLS